MPVVAPVIAILAEARDARQSVRRGMSFCGDHMVTRWQLI